MALLDQLLGRIEDLSLRQAVEAEVRQLKERTGLGIVFERHFPESVLLASNAGIELGDRVRFRTRPKERKTWTVEARDGDTITVRDADGAVEPAAVSDLLVVKNFDEPVYPTIRSVGSVRRGGDRSPHLIIESENFHALELLGVTHSGRFDCIYIDPPYNTGAPDWKYNNDFVDDNDLFRSSKWLSFMEKRLRIARKLLKPNGVLVVTIGENEIFHLGMLLERKELFADALRQPVTICINP
jgi:adenine-specific DNA-methyltransferase